MWSTSNGNEIKLILNKLSSVNLSKDAKEILDFSKNQYKVNLSLKVENYLEEFLSKKSKYNIASSFTYNKNIVICNTIISYYKY